MALGDAIHKALDFFFCDRCPTEANGRPSDWVKRLVNKLCPIQLLFRLLPKEEGTNPRRIFFPRSWLEGTEYHYAKEDDIR